MRFHEVARERDDTGAPAYEAIVFIGWDAESNRLACLWLDTTGGEGLTNGVIGYAVPAGDSIPFFFRFPDGSPFHTTFAYDRRTDTWEWHMDGETNGVRRPFARVTMSRKPPGDYDPEARLTELGITLPAPPNPVANYVVTLQSRATHGRPGPS